MNKRELLWNLVDYRNPEIVCICETWLNPNILNNEVLPPSYKLFRKDRADGYGGILIGVKCNVLSDLVDLSSESEACSVQIQLPHNKQLIIICAYRPPYPDLSYQTNLCNYVIDIVSRHPDAIVCCTGDFNLPDINWGDESISAHRYPLAINELLINMSVECGFTQMVNFLTRETNTLDLFFTSHPSLIQQCTSLPGISDHDIILTTIKSKISYQDQQSHKIYLWKKANLEEMSRTLSNYAREFTSHFTVDTPVDTVWGALRDKLLETLDTFVPSKIKKQNNNLRQPWITRRLIQLRRQKQRSYNRAKRTNLPFHWSQFKSLKRQMQKECRSTYNEYMSDIIHESYETGKKKKLFSYIKSLRSDYCGVPTLKVNDTSYSDNLTKANLLNKQFSSVFTTDSHSSSPDLGPDSYPDICQIEISIDGVNKLLRELDPSKSQGPDKVPARLLKLMANEISSSLSLVFSASLHQGIVPEDWKQAFVTPLYKKGARSNPANYRPISLTCICSKMLEHIVHTNIMSHLTNLNILSDSQFGFRKNYSAELQLIKTTHDIALNLNAKSQTDVILLDFSKAFDKVSHRLLLQKLQYYGISGQLLVWISSFLSNRTQRVVCGGQSSEPVDVASGVPQGSVLGPLLFLIFINDITSNLTSNCRLYADDCILYRRIDSQSDVIALQEDLKQLEIWEKVWNMKFNLEKCMVLHITLKTDPLLSDYSLHGHKLDSVSEAKYLGTLNYHSVNI